MEVKMDKEKILKWCGFTKDGVSWRFPVEGSFCIVTPDLDMNFYLKYAEPKLDRYRLENDWSKIEKHFAFVEVDNKYGQAWGNDPALAFGEALTKLIEG